MPLKTLIFAVGLALSTQASAAIDGLFGSDCLEVDGLSATKDLFFDDGQLLIVHTIYADSTCSNPAYDFAFSGRYTQYDEQLDYSFESISLKVYDDRISSAFSSEAICGISDWTTGEAREVAGLECGNQNIPAVGQSVFDRIQEDEIGIRLGQVSPEANALTPDQRPQSLDALLYKAK